MIHRFHPNEDTPVESGNLEMVIEERRQASSVKLADVEQLHAGE
jgi:hypothetical protein